MFSLGSVTYCERNAQGRRALRTQVHVLRELRACASDSDGLVVQGRITKLLLLQDVLTSSNGLKYLPQALRLNVHDATRIAREACRLLRIKACCFYFYSELSLASSILVARRHDADCSLMITDFGFWPSCRRVCHASRVWKRSGCCWNSRPACSAWRLRSSGGVQPRSATITVSGVCP